MDLPGSQPALELLRCLLAALLFLAPVGLALLKLTRRPLGPQDLGLALALGYAVLAPLMLAELHLGRPVLVLPVVLACALGVGASWRHLLDRRLAAELALPLAVAAWAAWVNAGDLALGADGLRLRLGADVSDRLFYSLVAHQAQAGPPPLTQHPLFAGLPFPYSYFPALLALGLERYAGLPLLSASLLALPALGLLLTALLAQACLRQMGVESRGARALATLLVALGSDLGWLLPMAPTSPLERSRHVYVFFMASGESLLFNSWMLGAPVALAAALAVGRWLRGGGWADLLAVALLGGALLETKLFAFAPVVFGAGLAGLLLRHPRLLAAGAALVAGALPWVALLAHSGAGGARFFFWPLAHVRRLLLLSPTLEPLARAALNGDGTVTRLAAWAVALALFLVGGFGARLAGLPALARAARADASGWQAFLAATLLSALVLGHSVGTWPLPADGAQFLLLAALFSSLWAGPALAAGLRSRAGRPLAAAGLALALAGPLGYAAVKKLPEATTAAAALDRRSLTVSPEVLSACRHVRAQARPGDSLLVPLGAPEAAANDFSNMLLAGLAGLPLVAYEFPFNLDPPRVAGRMASVRELYATRDPARGEALLAELGARWVWEDRRGLLGFRSARLTAVFWGSEVRLSEFR